MKYAISILILLFFPIMYKMVKDWNGFDHKSFNEISLTTAIITINCCFMNVFLRPVNQVLFFLQCLTVSITGFQLFFPYLINWRNSYNFGYTPPRLIYILNHLSDYAVPDKWPAYRALGWLGRLLLWSLLFTLSILWFYA